MRKLLVGIVAAATVLTAGAVAAQRSAPASAAASDPYTWKNVRIDGGGFVPGIVFNQTEQNLIYARTDIGGAYRWDAGQPGAGRRCWTGSAGQLGLQRRASAWPPTRSDPNKVYAAVGMYTNSWDPNNGAILRSSDKGATWQATALPFKLGGNMPGRGMGERLAVDPNNEQRPLLRRAQAATGCGAAPTPASPGRKVTTFPNAGNYVPGPERQHRLPEPTTRASSG